MRSVALFLCMFITCRTNAQQDPEFPKEFIMHLRLESGMISNFHSGSPGLFTGGISVVPQYTVVPRLIRAGVILKGFYANNKLHAAAGPTFSIKLKTLHARDAGSLGNIHISLDHLWASRKQNLAGGGLVLDLANRLIAGLHVHRDYRQNQWWLQSSLAFRISKVKKQKPVDL
jgi:hypothetical protein